MEHCSHVYNSPSFGLPYSISRTEKVQCDIRCKHKGNLVSSASGIGRDYEDAFQKALVQIELTIGTEWRNSTPAAPATAETGAPDEAKQ